MVGCIPPEPGGDEMSKRVLERLHHVPRPSLRPPTDADRLLHKQVRAARKVHKRAQTNKTLQENLLRRSIGDDSGIEGVATWNKIDRKPKFDAPRFQVDHPELYEQYCKDTDSYRRLHVLGERR